jgi:hypothetical protein
MRYGADGDVFVIGLGDLTIRAEIRISPNEADRMYDALTIYRAERDAIVLPVADEPELITGDAD